MNQQESAIVAAIRSDEIVGRGTCTSIDEAHTDQELIDRFGRTSSGRLRTPSAAVKAARQDEHDWQSVVNDIASTAF
jgi:hypothetical protein